MLDHLAQELVAQELFAQQLDAEFAALTAGERLGLLRETVPGRLVFTTSLGLEDQMGQHLIF
jgi:phosphoadenosine phosphosulfate reductase